MKSNLAISSIAFSNSGTELVIGDVDGKVVLWNSKGEVEYFGDLADVVKSPVALLRFSPDDSLFFAGSFFNSAVGNKLTLQQLSTSSSGSGSYDESGILYAAAFDTVNNDLVTGGEDRKVRLWDVMGQYGKALSGHDREVIYVSFIYFNNHRYILSSSLDHNIILWDDSGILQKFVGHEGNVTSVTFGGDGTTILSESEDLTTREWNLKGVALDHILKTGENTENGKTQKDSGFLLELERFLENEKTDSLYQRLKRDYGVD
jgi:WD40 repeat protein